LATPLRVFRRPEGVNGGMCRRHHPHVVVGGVLRRKAGGISLESNPDRIDITDLLFGVLSDHPTLTRSPNQAFDLEALQGLAYWSSANRKILREVTFNEALVRPVTPIDDALPNFAEYAVSESQF
jgi:hypothetical protein